MPNGEPLDQGTKTFTGSSLRRMEQMETEIARLQDDNIRLRGEAEDHEKFIEELSVFVPDSYDGDEAAEALILRWAKDVDTLAGIVSRLTSSYR